MVHKVGVMTTILLYRYFYELMSCYNADLNLYIRPSNSFVNKCYSFPHRNFQFGVAITDDDEKPLPVK